MPESLVILQQNTRHRISLTIVDRSFSHRRFILKRDPWGGEIQRSPPTAAHITHNKNQHNMWLSEWTFIFS